ncbi:MAG TPA: Asp-tRNA(Asn)/Glu-tRNA(Gln) amidotransferase GatCAB subunit B, partial [Gammaproteobacteria bacterium]|nr:Asp-tRNA(Asn)/Glu-tRNA(Gln) amidotransferase GatCAB subunit B [Gammaproteobacteria bacterium]
FEVDRQIELIESGGVVRQETRLYDPDKGETRPMRSKEEAMDYRYFPDPDLLPVEITAEMLERGRESLPELPDAKKTRFINDYRLSEGDATLLIASREMADYFETVVKISGDSRLSANWIMGELAGFLNKENRDISDSPVSAEMLAGMIIRIKDNTISGKIAKEVFEAMWAGEGDADAIIDSRGLKQITDTGAIESVLDEIIAANPKQFEQLKGGKDKLMGFFVGQVMKQTQGKANPAQVNALMKKKLEA